MTLATNHPPISVEPPAHLGRRQTTGVALVLLATLAWSLSGLFTRLLATDVWTAVAWRSFFGGSFLLIVQCVREHGRFWTGFGRLGVAGWSLAGAQVICQACTVGAFFETTVADVTLIYATAPFLSAGLAWWWLGERLQPRTVLAGLVALGGTLVIVADALHGGHLPGDLLALGMTASFAAIIVIPRARPDLPTLPATILSAALTVALFMPFASTATMAGRDWLDLAAFGFTNFTLALFLFIAGVRRIPAAQAALIGTLELPLSPAWVWLAFGEAPGLPVLLGGAITAAAVVSHTALDLAGTRDVEPRRATS